MADIRAMVVLQGGSALPEDRFINTWHFSNGDPYATHFPIVQEALADFYIEVPAGETDAVGEFISPYVSRSAEIRTYDLADPEPRVPETVGLTLPAVSSPDGLPEECAVVLSFHGAPPITGRRRGRVFIGPLTVTAYDEATTTTPSRIPAPVRNTLASAAEGLMATDAGWCIRSVAGGGTMVPVVGGWIDNAVDIQRRRGIDSSLRRTWP